MERGLGALGVPGPGPEHPHGNLLETAAAAVSWIILRPLETPLGWGELTTRRVVDPSGKPPSPPFYSVIILLKKYI